MGGWGRGISAFLSIRLGWQPAVDFDTDAERIQVGNMLFKGVRWNTDSVGILSFTNPSLT
jgi:hypothetical protein